MIYPVSFKDGSLGSFHFFFFPANILFCLVQTWWCLQTLTTIVFLIDLFSRYLALAQLTMVGPVWTTLYAAHRFELWVLLHLFLTKRDVSHFLSSVFLVLLLIYYQKICPVSAFFIFQFGLDRIHCLVNANYFDKK